MSDKDRKDEFFAISLGARRRDAGTSTQKAAVRPKAAIASVPSPQADLLQEFYRSLTPEQRALYRKALDS